MTVDVYFPERHYYASVSMLLLDMVNRNTKGEKKASVYNIKLLDCYSDSAWAYMFVCFPHITDDLHVSHKKVSFITLMLVLDFYCFY